MAKIFRLSCFLIDKTGLTSIDDVKASIGNILCSSRHVHLEEAEMKSDDFTVLADPNCDLAECQKYFDNTGTTEMNKRPVKVGEVYRHFKGKLVKVIAISQDSEVPGRYNVVYNCGLGCFNRPYDMFVSEVDHIKYPDVKQKYRFEKVED